MSELINKFSAEGYLVSPDLSKSFNGDINLFLSFVKSKYPNNNLINHNIFNEFILNASVIPEHSIKILKNFNLVNESRDINHWFGYFNTRYEKLKKILQSHPELQSVISINRADNIVGLNKFSVICMVNNFHETSKGNIILSVEDPTGSMSVIVNKNSPINGLTKELVEDEVIGLNVSKSGNWFFANNIVFPDIPVKEVKECGDDVNAVFISDTHVGSDIFLHETFQRFIDWLKGDSGSEEQKLQASKVKYLFYIGDLVDGVGVYPDQDSELEIKDIYNQYSKTADYLKQIPQNIKIIVCPGNHDALRISLPQYAFNNDYSAPINKLPNVIPVSNPSLINVGCSKNFSGFDVLMYHGNSFDYYISNTPHLRQAGYEHPEQVMEFLLRKRHLAPTHGSTLIAPSIDDDFLVIDKVPDIFASGHIHQSSISQYKGVITMNTSCFQGQSDFMKRVGITPKPGKVPVFNFKSKKSTIIDFN